MFRRIESGQTRGKFIHVLLLFQRAPNIFIIASQQTQKFNYKLQMLARGGKHKDVVKFNPAGGGKMLFKSTRLLQHTESKKISR